MDIQELKQFESVYQPSKEIAFCWLGKQYVQLSTEENHAEVVDHANDSLRIWQAAKAQSDKKIKLLLCDEHLQKCESPTGIFNSQYPDEEPCLICLAKEAKSQSVPEWIDYTKQSPQMDGNYQIFIKGEQITAKWVSRFGFADPIEGDALRQELITHWAMQPQSPKAQELTHD